MTTTYFTPSGKTLYFPVVYTAPVILGYVQENNISGNFPNVLTDTKFNQLTHVIYTSAYPTGVADATLIGYNGTNLTATVTAIHTAGWKCLCAISDGANGRLAAIIANGGLLATFVTNITTLVSTYDLDGIEIDWETASFTQALMTTLIDALYAVLHPLHKLLTSAGWCGQTAPGTTDVSLATSAKLDYIMVMAYDMNFPKPLPAHAPYEECIDGIYRWVAAGFDKKKLILGIPLYADDDAGALTSWGHVVTDLAPTDDLNQSTVANITGFDGGSDAVSGGVLWYNGVDLAVHKLRFANAYGLAGVGLFNISYDAVNSEYSIIQHIYDNRLTTCMIYDGLVAADADDSLAYYDPGAAEWVLIAGNYIGAGREYSTGGGNKYKVGSGIRVTGVPAAFKGSTVLYGQIAVTAETDRGGTICNTKIRGELGNAPAAFSDIANYQARRGLEAGGDHDDHITTAVVAWDAIGTWLGDPLFKDYFSPDIKTVLQELANQATMGTVIVLFWDDHEARSTANLAWRTAYSYAGSATKCARVHVEYIP